MVNSFSSWIKVYTLEERKLKAQQILDRMAAENCFDVYSKEENILLIRKLKPPERKTTEKEFKLKEKLREKIKTKRLERTGTKSSKRHGLLYTPLNPLNSSPFKIASDRTRSVISNLNHEQRQSITSKIGVVLNKEFSVNHVMCKLELISHQITEKLYEECLISIISKVKETHVDGKFDINKLDLSSLMNSIIIIPSLREMVTELEDRVMTCIILINMAVCTESYDWIFKS
jgi:hypothetical protein